MKSRNRFDLSIRVAALLMLATLFQLTAQARGGDDPPKIDTRSVAEVVSESLGKLGCKHFLGRRDEYLCNTNEGEAVCEAFKKTGEVKDCKRSHSGPPRIAPPFKQIVDNSLGKLGCKHFLGRDDEYLCANREGAVACGAFLKNGEVKDCKTATRSSAPKDDGGQKNAGGGVPHIDGRSSQEVVSESLGKLGCKHFLGRRDEYLCNTNEGEAVCEAFKKTGEVKDCKRSHSGPPRIAPPFKQIVDNSLGKLGCKHFLGRDDEYLCASREGYAACEAFMKSGNAKDCKKANQ